MFCSVSYVVTCAANVRIAIVVLYLGGLKKRGATLVDALQYMPCNLYICLTMACYEIHIKDPPER